MSHDNHYEEMKLTEKELHEIEMNEMEKLLAEKNKECINNAISNKVLMQENLKLKLVCFNHEIVQEKYNLKRFNDMIISVTDTRNKLKDSIRERLSFEGEFGYNPDTLEVILNKKEKPKGE